jgi:hypothetical protein
VDIPLKPKNRRWISKQNN